MNSASPNPVYRIDTLSVPVAAHGKFFELAVADTGIALHRGVYREVDR